MAGIRQLCKSSRIRCTTCWPHQENQKKVGHHTWKHVACQPACSWNLWHAVSLSSKGGKWRFRRRPSAVQTREKRSIEAQAQRQVVQHIDFDGVRPEIRLIVSLYVDELPDWKCVNSEVRTQSTVSPNGVPSNGSMAPCWSHHGHHTRQELILHRICRELNPMQAKLD